MIRHEDLQEDELVLNRVVRICFEDYPEYDYSTIVNGTRQEIIDYFAQGPLEITEERVVSPTRIEFLNCGKYEDETIIAEI